MDLSIVIGLYYCRNLYSQYFPHSYYYSQVLEVIVGRLYCNKALWQKDPQRVTKFMLLSGREQFRKRDAEGYVSSSTYIFY